jgi:hypothetical protein
VTRKVEQLIVRLAEENRDWGDDRIAGALANLGYRVCHQTVGNVLQCHGLPPAPERKRTTTWSAFIRTHLALLAGTDFFTAEVLALRGLQTWSIRCARRKSARCALFSSAILYAFDLIEHEGEDLRNLVPRPEGCTGEAPPRY